MDDSALVAAMAEKDPAGLDGAYRRYADRLYAYARTLVGDSHAAADVVHDTFLLANQHVTKLRDPDRLAQWLYAIARREGLRTIKQRSRTAPLESAPEWADSVDLTRELQAAEVSSLVHDAMLGLSEADREIASLAVRHQMSAVQVADVLGIGLNNAHARLSRVREQLEICIGVLLVARQSEGSCAALAEIVKNWDGRLNPLLRKRLHRHIEDCVNCSGVKRRRMTPAALLSAYAALPFLAVGPLRRTGNDVPEGDWHRDSGFPTTTQRRVLAPALIVGLIVALLAGGGAAAMMRDRPLAAPPQNTLPPVAVSASPTPSITPPAPPPPPPPPPAFNFTATATLTCLVPGGDYTLTVKITANENLSLAFLKTPADNPMAIDGKTAERTITGFNPDITGTIPWRVQAFSSDGDERLLSRNSDHPC